MSRVPRAAILPPTPANLRKLAAVLARGGLVAVPTETVYGLAADALNARACAEIFRAKGRPHTDPLIVHVASAHEAETLAVVNDAARKVMAAFWPGPLTIVLPKRGVVPDIVTAGGASVAVRCPAHATMRKLMALTRRPLAAPSANPFGYISPTTARHVQNGLGERIRFILDGGASQVGVESTILDLTHPAAPRILRSGGISAAQLRRVLGRTVATVNRTGSAKRRQAAPGMLTQHYSPDTPLTLHDTIPLARLRSAKADEAFLLFRQPRAKIPASVRVYVLSPRGQIEDAARRLYAGMHELDHAGFRRLHAELAPERGAGIAINDRLRRAAAKRSAK